MTPLEFVDLLVDLLLGILYRLTHLVSGLVRLVGCGVLLGVKHENNLVRGTDLGSPKPQLGSLNF